LRMPVTHRRAIRTTNLLERLFVEEWVISNKGTKRDIKL
jgi:hypothetical protein